MKILNRADFAKLAHISRETFFSLICARFHRHDVIFKRSKRTGIKWTISECANAIVNDWKCDWLEMGKLDDFFTQCKAMYEGWDYAKMEPLVVEITPHTDALINGHHRSFVLGSLLLQNKIEVQPIPVLNTANLSFTQSDTAILISYSTEEFLTFSKLAPDQPTLGEFVRNVRTSHRELYEECLHICAQKWTDIQKYTDERADYICAKLHIRDNKLDFYDIVIDEKDEALATIMAFTADAALQGLTVGDVQIPLFRPSVKVLPPYVS